MRVPGRRSAWAAIVGLVILVSAATIVSAINVPTILHAARVEPRKPPPTIGAYILEDPLLPRGQRLAPVALDSGRIESAIVHGVMEAAATPNGQALAVLTATGVVPIEPAAGRAEPLIKIPVLPPIYESGFRHALLFIDPNGQRAYIVVASDTEAAKVASRDYLSIVTVDLGQHRLVSERRVLGSYGVVQSIQFAIQGDNLDPAPVMGSDGLIWFIAAQSGPIASNGIRDDEAWVLNPRSGHLFGPIDVEQFAVTPQFPSSGGDGYLLTGIEHYIQGMNGTVNVGSLSCTLERINDSLRTITQVANIPLECASLSVSSDGNIVYVCGGIVGGNENEILPVDMATGRLGTPIPLPGDAARCAGSGFLSSDGRLASFDISDNDMSISVGDLDLASDRTQESVVMPFPSLLVTFVEGAR
jgi:hypothetical protein